MKPYSEILQITNSYHELGETIQAANFVVEEYGIKHPNFELFSISGTSLGQPHRTKVNVKLSRRTINKRRQNDMRY